MQNLQCYSIVKKKKVMFIHIVHGFQIDFEQIWKKNICYCMKSF